MQQLKRTFCIVIGMFCLFFGIAGSFIYAIAQGDTQGRIVGAAIGFLVALFGIWLIRRVEKSFWKLIEGIIDAVFLTWP